MSFIAITTISEAEENARRLKAQAVTDAKTAEHEAKIAGEAAVKEAIERASEEVRNKRATMDAEANVAAQKLADDVENKKAVMRASATSRKDKAASLIVERIVNG